MVFWPPIHGIFIPLPWYIDPPTHVIFTSLSLVYRSPTHGILNSLDLTIRNLPLCTFSSFKLKLQRIFYTKRWNPQYYSIGDRFLSVLHSRMRNKCSVLNADLYHANLIILYWSRSYELVSRQSHANGLTISHIINKSF